MMKKKWANAVLVSSSYRNSDGTDSFDVGDEVPEEAVLAYYVWIPRYKYKVFNINKEIGIDSYNAKDTGIDIKFEEERKKTGTINCNYDFNTTNGLSEKCSGSNGEYYTHPAFTFGDKELEGIWVAKYELSSTTAGNDNVVTQIRIKPNLLPLTYNTITSFSNGIQNMNVVGNEYGLSSDKSKVDSHLIKNMEWGAVAYLTNSKYGNCSNDVCSELGINSYYDSTSETAYKTGCGPQNINSASSGNVCYRYDTELGKLASTTGNVYGIYDLSGGTYEYVMGNQSSITGSYNYSVSNGGSNYSYSNVNAKYIDTYAYGTTYNDQTAYNRSRLGDATGEVSMSSLGGGWYDDYGYFTYSTNSWFRRGGDSRDGLEMGIFNYRRNDGNSTFYNSARAVLIIG